MWRCKIQISGGDISELPFHTFESSLHKYKCKRAKSKHAHTRTHAHTHTCTLAHANMHCTYANRERHSELRERVHSERARAERACAFRLRVCVYVCDSASIQKAKTPTSRRRC